MTRRLAWGVLILLMLLSAACGTSVRKLHPTDLPHLPKTEGFYGGKMLLPPEWVYAGSSARYHRFLYTYTRGNRFYQIRVWVKKSYMDLPFAKPLEDMPRGGIEVILVYDEVTGRNRFAKVIPPNPKDSSWMNFRAEPEWIPPAPLEPLPVRSFAPTTPDPS